MKNAETTTSILRGNSPCPNLKGRLVEQAIESERPSNVMVFGKCSAGLKATSRKGAAEFWNEVRASASGCGANVPVITCHHSPRWFILPLDPAHEKKPTLVERERIEKEQPKKEENLCTMHEEEAVAPLQEREREGILLMQARSR